VLRLDHPAGAPGLLDVFGGKLTTHRRLAEDALEKIETVIGRRGKPWTRNAKLPGGDFAPTDFAGEVARTVARHVNLPRELIERLVRLYGTKTAVLLDGVETVADLGEEFGAGLSAREVDYLVAHEWARTAEDILWRRTKLGLHGADRGKLENYLQKKEVGGS
jgi:glycerol-3-phosphate dehydrogenase